MTFLNAALAFGALAFTIPLAIHLLARSRFRTVDWGAMHLLQSVLKTNRRRLQLLHLLLLVLRCLVPVLLALCLARPLLTGFKSLPGDAAQSLVIVIDDSRSMAARTADGTTRFENARRSVSEMIGGLSRRDEVVLIPTSRLQRSATTTSPDAAARDLLKLRATFGPVSIDAMLRAAITALERASHSQQRIVIVSDFQSHTTDSSIDAAIGRMADRIAQLPASPRIGLLRVANDFQNESGNASANANVSVQSVAVASPAVVAGRLTTFVTEIRNGSDEPAAGVPVTWLVDGRASATRRMTLPPRATISLQFRKRIVDPGLHEIAVSLEVGDALPEDNVRRLAVDAMEAVDVLVIEGAPSGEPLGGSASYVALALKPFAAEDFRIIDQDDEAASFDSFRVTATLPGRVASSRREIEEPIVLLCNVAINRQLKSKLARHLIRGGHLVIFDGDKVNPDAYNAAWTAGGVSLNLPAKLGQRRIMADESRRGQDDQNNAARSTGIRVGRISPVYPPWQMLGNEAEQPLSDVLIKSYRKLELPESVDETIIAISLASREPLVVAGRPRRTETQIDDQTITGRIVQFATAADVTDSNLPLRSSFVPMIQQLLLGLAGKQSNLNLDVGQTIELSPSTWDQRGPAIANASGRPHASSKSAADALDDMLRDADRIKAWVEDPSGTVLAQQQAESIDQLGTVVATQSSGRHELKLRAIQNISGKPVVTKNGVAANLIDRWVNVEVPAIESNLLGTQPERLRAIAARFDGAVHVNVADLLVDDRNARYGREIWQGVWLALLVLLVAELILLRVLRGGTVRQVMPTLGGAG